LTTTNKLISLLLLLRGTKDKDKPKEADPVVDERRGRREFCFLESDPTFDQLLAKLESSGDVWIHICPYTLLIRPRHYRQADLCRLVQYARVERANAATRSAFSHYSAGACSRTRRGRGAEHQPIPDQPFYLSEVARCRR